MAPSQLSLSLFISVFFLSSLFGQGLDIPTAPTPFDSDVKEQDTKDSSSSDQNSSVSVPSQQQEGLPLSSPGSFPGERRTCVIANMVYAFRWCPSGSFMMGSPEIEEGRFPVEPEHQVTLTAGFWILETEVTQGMWKSVMSKNPSWFSQTGSGAARVRQIDTDLLPVEQVTWEESELFCQTLSSISGLKIDLPTEAQWEYACRAETTTTYSFGTIIRPDDANYNDSDPQNIAAEKHAVRNPYQVGSFPPNPWGIHDMHGNVSEWCRDRYGILDSNPVTDPMGSDIGNDRVFRGGSWYFDATCCRSAYRFGLDPDTRAYYQGFRIIIKIK